MDEPLAVDFLNHEARDLHTPHRELYKRALVQMGIAYPDRTLVIEDLVTEGDRVTARWRAHGTHPGWIEGMPATGKRDEVSGVTVVRVVKGKITEFWKQVSEIRDP